MTGPKRRSLAQSNANFRRAVERLPLGVSAAYGEQLKAGIAAIRDRRGIVHSFSGHPAMFGLFFAATPPDTYRDWKRSDYSFYDALAPNLHDAGVICEPDSREPLFACAAHDAACLAETLGAFETALDRTLEQVEARRA